MVRDTLRTRRAFLTASAAAVLLTATADPASALRKPKRLPVGLELYSVRDALAKDLTGTLRAVAGMGYEAVEFYAPYQSWSPQEAKEVRRLLDDLKIKCLSTHNNRANLEGDGLKKSIELNRILGSKTLVMASAGRAETPDDWKGVAETLNRASETLKGQRMRVGYHNHQTEFRTKDGFVPMPYLAANTVKDVTLQFDVGTCIDAGFDPVAWIRANPGRIRSLHLKDWGRGPGRGYRVLFNEGDTPWAVVLDAAASVGGAEYLLIEQEGSRYPSLDTVRMCLQNFRALRP